MPSQEASSQEASSQEASSQEASSQGLQARGLRERLRQTRPFESPAQAAMLSLMVAGAVVEQEMEQACARYDLSASHYNVLRILAGGPEEGYARCDIIERLIDRGPDVTRLMDRLEEQHLVHRRRSQKDRRVMLHRITDEGRARLGEMHADVCAVQRRFAGSLTEEDQQALVRLCEKVYGAKS